MQYVCLWYPMLQMLTYFQTCQSHFEIWALFQAVISMLSLRFHEPALHLIKTHPHLSWQSVVSASRSPSPLILMGFMLNWTLALKTNCDLILERSQTDRSEGEAEEEL